MLILIWGSFFFRFDNDKVVSGVFVLVAVGVFEDYGVRVWFWRAYVGFGL
jgi:hypothetical protein